jgi:Phosphotransferase enzyme family
VSRPSTFCPPRAYYLYLNIRGAAGTTQSDSNRNDDHCKTAAIPTLREEDAKRPSRERESLVGEQSRLVNRMKATLIRLGIRGFNPKLRHAEQRLETAHTRGRANPGQHLAELKRDVQRRRCICDQIPSIEQERLERLERISIVTGQQVILELDPAAAAQVDALVARTQQLAVDCAAFTATPVTTHDDLNASNLIGPLPMLVDWEYAQLADPVYDLACLSVYYPGLRLRGGELLGVPGSPTPTPPCGCGYMPSCSKA